MSQKKGDILKQVITKIVRDWHLTCAEYDNDYCDSSLCAECGRLPVDIKFEHCKQDDTCFACFGYGMAGLTLADMEIERDCNICGGSGKFLVCAE